MNIHIIVSDIFFSAYNNCEMMSYSEAIKKLKNNEFHDQDCLVKGQGLLSFEEEELISIATSINPKLIEIWKKQKLASTNITHKRRIENVLISPPILNSSSIYESDFILSSLNELIIDHITGEHIQGMVLIEASRQMFIAVSNLVHQNYKNEIRSYFVFNKMAVNFLYFTFPLPAKIYYKLISIEEDDTKTHIIAKLWVLQNDITTFEIEVEYSLFSSDLLRKKEIQKCNKAIKNYKQQLFI